ncbi:RDD family protein [Agrococcus sp. SL85]|uniref:RDD family protein n=1 Tax=Agrococcus sp. SL85 TaxID=2995141 RepID=UPI00226CB22A|nr:RDD family protein [Agrococcus sp. SL85]WAC66726.1 RDD family protein [Agrococcus sp. SL85]
MIWEIDEGRRTVEGLDEDGRPDPEYAAALGLRRAPAGRRAVASLIEFGIWALLQLPYWIVALPTLLKVATGSLQPWGLASHPDLVWMVVATVVSSVLTLAFVIVQLVLHGRKGVTLGKAIMGLRSVNVKTLAKPGIGAAVLRGLVLWASFLVPVIGPALFLASPLLDREKRGRGWLDHAAGTWFVDVREGLDPYHEKRMRIARKTVAAEPEAERSQLPSLATPADSAAAAYRPGARIRLGRRGRRAAAADGRAAARGPVVPAVGAGPRAHRARHARGRRAPRRLPPGRAERHRRARRAADTRGPRLGAALGRHRRQRARAPGRPGRRAGRRRALAAAAPAGLARGRAGGPRLGAREPDRRRDRRRGRPRGRCRAARARRGRARCAGAGRRGRRPHDPPRRGGRGRRPRGHPRSALRARRGSGARLRQR